MVKKISVGSIFQDCVNQSFRHSLYSRILISDQVTTVDFVLLEETRVTSFLHRYCHLSTHPCMSLCLALQSSTSTIHHNCIGNILSVQFPLSSNLDLVSNSTCTAPAFPYHVQFPCPAFSLVAYY